MPTRAHDPHRSRLSSMGILVLSALAASCEDELDRLDREYGEAALQRLEAVDACLVRAEHAPPATSDSHEWLRARQRLEKAERLTALDLGDALESVEAIVTATRAEVAEFTARVAFDAPGPIVFAESTGEGAPGQNAATIVLGPEGDRRGDEFRRWNASAAWYIDGFPTMPGEEAQHWYELVSGLEYVLVVRCCEVLPPSFEEEHEDGYRRYSLGAVEADAQLFRLDGEELLTSFRLVAAGQPSAASIAGFEPFLPSEPEDAVDSLHWRLFSTLHDHAAAVAAELSDDVVSAYRLEHSVLGTRLVRVDRARFD